MPSICIRVATTQDAPALAAIYAPYVQSTPISFEFSAPGPEEFARRLQALAGRFPWFVCEWEGRVAGYAYASPFGERQGFAWAAETAIYIGANMQGKGIGQRLYAALFETMRRLGYYSLYARIAAPNPQSEGFHTRLGFVPEATLHKAGCKFGQWHDLAYYLYTLRPYAENPAPPMPFSFLKEEELRPICQKAAEG